MGSRRCDGCQKPVPVAGGIANIWTFDNQQTGGLTLELDDGSEHFLCFSCVGKLPDVPTEADIAELD